MPIIHRQTHGNTAVLVWDDPDRAVNTKSLDALGELDEALALAMEDEGVDAIVVRSGKSGFVAGGDLGELQRITQVDQARALSERVRRTMDTISRCPKPVVAALNGAVLGGGLELALACQSRIAEDGTQLGFPEVTLGLIPGAGGTQRLPRLIGLERALPMLCDGRSISAARALEIGLVDQVVSNAELETAALAVASRANRRALDKPMTLAESDRPLIEAARKKAHKRAGLYDVAELRLTEVVEAGVVLPLKQALDVETAAFADAVVSPAAKNRIRTSFFAVNDARAMKARPDGVPVTSVGTLGVVGAGLMGGGIAFTAASNKIDVVLIDIDESTLASGMQAIHATAKRQVDAGRISSEQADETLARISPTTNYDRLGSADVAIEAVVERRDVKAAVINAISAALPAGAPIASNTSTIPITELAAHSDDPARFIGLHFFGPVERMPLVEVIRGRETTDKTLAAALDLLRTMRKTPVIVHDGNGFYTSRVVATYTAEALTLVAEGIAPDIIDEAAKAFGMVIGPCAMNDMTGLPLLIDIFTSVRSTPGRIANAGDRSLEALEKLVGAGRTGRRAGRGLYNYTDGKASSSAEVVELFPAGKDLHAETIRKRLMHVQALETVRAMDEGIVTSASDADVGSVLGWMFPKGSGGVISYIDTVGVSQFCDDCDELAKRFGGRFSVPDGLRERARTGRPFHAV